MRKFHGSMLLNLAILLIVLVSPVSAAFASGSFAQNGSVIASAVVVPAQTSQLGFIISAPVKDILVREGDMVQAGQVLVVLNTPDLEYAVVAAEAAHRSAEAYAELQRYKLVKDFRNGKFIYDVAPPEVRQRADAQALQAKTAMEIAQATLAQNTLIAPYDGIIVSIDVVTGEFVGQGQVVVTFATLNDLIIETTDLSERDITKIKIGDLATINIDALNETVNGRVIAIAPKADVVGGDVVFKVTIAMDNQLKGLLWGMTAEVAINE